MLASGVLRVGGPVGNPTWDTVSRFGDTASHKAVDIERNSSNRGCFVAAWKSSNNI